jgi:putative oxidoreductase
MKIFLTLARLVIGGLFIGHGTQKLFGWFGGHGLEGTAGFFEAIGLRPGKRHAMMAGGSEAGGGALLALGVATPLAAAALSGVMITAIRAVHLEKGPWVTQGGYEYNLVLLVALAAIAEEEAGPGWAAAALAAGAAGSYSLMATAESPQEGVTASSEPAAQPATAA